MKSKLFALVFFFLWAVPCFAIEVVDTAWVRRYNGPGNSWDGAQAIAVDGSGNVYVTGKSVGSGSDYDFATIKYYPNGDTAWIRRFNGPGNARDEVLAIALDGSGNVYVSGNTLISGVNWDYAIVKYYPNGDTAWVRTYNGPGNLYDDAWAVIVDDSGNVYVTGGSVGIGTYYDYATIKYDPNGNELWVKRYNGPGNDDDGCWGGIGIDNSGNVAVTGKSWGSGTDYDYATIKYYPNGDTVWVRRYNGPADSTDMAYAMTVDGSGNVYVTGGSIGSGTYEDYATIKYHPNGDTAWVRRYNGPGNGDDWGNAIAVDDSGNVYANGFSYGSGTDYDYATIKYDASGNELWVRRYNGPGNSIDYGYALALDDSGNVYVTGASRGMGTYGDYATIKYFSNGDTAWIIRYNGLRDSTDMAFDIAVDESGQVYVTGRSYSSGTDHDYATIKYIQYDSIPFAPAVNYGAGDGPYSVFCADLDSDTDMDLALANWNSDNVSILKNYGDGSFESTVNYGAGHYSHSLFCADLDGDGDLDLAVANPGSNNISILKNNGDGSFQSAVNYEAGYVPFSPFCADLDGDGDLDLVVASSNSDNVSILKNNGDGSFQSAVNYGAGDFPISVFCADLDGDGDLDLAVANGEGDNVSILKNNGDGTFQSAVNYETGDSPYFLFCADLDGDTDLDLAVANRLSNNVSILKNNGDGSFQSALSYGTGDSPRSVFCADLDGDTDLDLAVANDVSNNVSILKNNGDGTFQGAVNYGAGSTPVSVFCADLDGDTDLDLAVANYSSDKVSILKNLTQIPANQPPWAFSLISPEDQDTIFGSTTFQWHIPYDPNFGDQMRYDLYISTSPGFEPLYTTIDSNLAVSKFATVVDSGTYYWKVKAKDNWGAERWSTETWSLVSRYLTDTLTIIAFSPVDLIVTDPIGDSIGIAFNTIPNADYDTTTDYDHDGDKDDIITIPDRLVGDYLIRVVAEPGDTGTYDLGIRIDGSSIMTLATDHPSPSPGGEPDTFSYNAPWYLRGDPNGDWKISITDVVYLINYLFLIPPGPAPIPQEAGDANCDGMINVTDVVYLINYLFLVPPGPPPGC